MFLLPFAGAYHEPCEPTTSKPEVDTGETPAGRYYYDCDFVLTGVWCVNHAYLYEESNGIDGLQRKDETSDDTCDGMIPSDTLIW